MPRGTRLNIATFCRFWLLLGVTALYGQEQAGTSAAQPAITTDRPAITDSSTVVPRGELLFENGFTDTGNNGQRSFDFPATLVRFGLTSKTELRFSTPDYFNNVSVLNGFGSGWGDSVLGVKRQIAARDVGFDASLIVSLSLPTGAQKISSHGYDPQVQLPWSQALSDSWTVAGMFSLFWPTEGGSRNLTGQSTFLLDRQITTRWDAFLEYAGQFAQNGGPQHLLHTGTSFKITPNQQLDFHCGFGLSSAAVDHFIGFGYSFQFQAFRHPNRDR